MKIITWLAAVVFILLTLGMRQLDTMVVEATGVGVFDFEMVWTPAGAERVLNAWGAEQIAIQRSLASLDFGYIASYVTLITGAIVLISWHERNRRWQQGAKVLVWLPVTAGGCDIAENIALLHLLANTEEFNSSAPAFASTAATIKFGLIVIAVGGFLVLWLRRLVRARK